MTPECLDEYLSIHPLDAGHAGAVLECDLLLIEAWLTGEESRTVYA